MKGDNKYASVEEKVGKKIVFKKMSIKKLTCKKFCRQSYIKDIFRRMFLTIR